MCETCLILTVLDNLKASSQNDIAVQAQDELSIYQDRAYAARPAAQGNGFAAQSINLRPTGYSGLDVIAKYIFGDQRVISIV